MYVSVIHYGVWLIFYEGRRYKLAKVCKFHDSVCTFCYF